MLKHRGEEKTGKGTYWNFTTGERIQLKGEGVLPGSKEATYYKFSTLTILLLGPIFGLAYAALMPFVGLAMGTKVVARKVFRLFSDVSRAVADASSFGWRPDEAYLEGKRKKVKKEKKAQ
jgi:hypothetical protein